MTEKSPLSTVGLIVNPISGSWPLTMPAVQYLVAMLREKGFDPEVNLTRYAGHARQLAYSLKDQKDLIVVAGGDGTVNEVVGALMGSSTPMAVIPMGTANVLAKELGMPWDMFLAADVISKGRVRLFDVGLAGDRHFMLFAGIGFDARVSAELKRLRGGHITYLDYIVPLVRAFKNYIPHRFAVIIDGTLVTAQACHLVIGNVRSYGGPIEFTSWAKFDDGLLDVCVFLGAWKRDVVRYLISAVLRRHLDQTDVRYYTGQVIELEGARNAPCQLDGDFRTPTPTKFKIVPQALRVIAP